MKEKVKIIGSTILGLVLGFLVIGGVYFLASTFVADYNFYKGVMVGNEVGQQNGLALANQDFQKLLSEGKIVIPEVAPEAPVLEVTE